MSKVLRMLPMKYGSKVSTLEEWGDLDHVTVDELHGILTAYEMRMILNESSRKEATFKASSKNQSENLDDEESLFIKNLKRVLENIKESYPCNFLAVEELEILLQNLLTLNKMIVMREKPRNSKRVKQETRRSPMRKNKIVYTMEDSEDGDTSEYEETEILFMGLDTQYSNDDSYEEG